MKWLSCAHLASIKNIKIAWITRLKYTKKKNRHDYLAIDNESVHSLSSDLRFKFSENL